MSVFDDLKSAVIEYNQDKAATCAQSIVDEGLDPLAGLDSISEAMTFVGEGYSNGTLWLPDLVGAAGASQAAMPILEEEIRKRGQKSKSLGTVVLGTVAGDIHTIGKSMVGVLLVAQGFRVVDIGADVPASRFVKAVKEESADILALSALLTTTAPQMGKVIDALKDANLREKVKIMVGGGAITEEFSQMMGADGYAATAPGAVDLAKDMLAQPA